MKNHRINWTGCRLPECITHTERWNCCGEMFNIANLTRLTRLRSRSATTLHLTRLQSTWCAGTQGSAGRYRCSQQVAPHQPQGISSLRVLPRQTFFDGTTSPLHPASVTARDRTIKTLAMSEAQKIAIVSVFDKTGLLDLAKGLVQQNVRILASGGTARMIRESGFPVECV